MPVRSPVSRPPEPTAISPDLLDDIRRLKRTAPWMLILLAIAGVFGLAYFAAGLLMGPQDVWRDTSLKPGRFGLSPKTVSFESRDRVRLKAWWERSWTVIQPKGTVILLHGTNMNKSGMAYLAGKLLARGYNVLVPDLRAHGESAGHYATCGYMEALDVLAALRFARQQSDHGPIALLGYSSGAVAALYAAGEAQDVDAVIADSAYISISDVLARESSYLRSPEPKASVPLMHRARLWLFSAPGMHELATRMFRIRSGVALEPPDQGVLKAVARINRTHVLYARSEDDPVVPPEETRKLLDHTATPNKRLLVLPGRMHSAMLANVREYISRVEDFLDQAMPAAETQSPVTIEPAR